MATQRQPHETQTDPFFFDPLEPDGSNYLGWNIDMRAYLCAEEFDATIAHAHEEEISTSHQWQSKQGVPHLQRTTPEAKGKLEAQAHVEPIFQTPKVRKSDQN